MINVITSLVKRIELQGLDYFIDIVVVINLKLISKANSHQLTPTKHEENYILLISDSHHYQKILFVVLI